MERSGGDCGALGKCESEVCSVSGSGERVKDSTALQEVMTSFDRF